MNNQPLILRKGMVIGMGNSMLDLIGYVNEDVLVKYSLEPNNGYLAEEQHMPLFKELVNKYDAKYAVGGSAQNTLRVTQWVLKVPEVCIMFGAIGNDEQGELLVNKARSEGVDTQYQYIQDIPTGICAVLLTKNGVERTLVANLSASNHFTTDHLLKPENQERMCKADVIYVAGFLFSVNVDAIMHVATCATGGSAWFAMNLSAAFLAERYMEEWLKVMPYVDILFGNDTEAMTFSKVSGFKTSNDIHKIALELTGLPKIRPARQRIVVITQGHEPVIVAKDGVVKVYPVIQVKPDYVVDSTGAGDAFVGGFLAQLIQNAPLDECVTCGIWCASQMVQQHGCSLDGLIRYKNSSSRQE